MNAATWLRRLLTVGAVLEGLAGLGLLLIPSEMIALLLGSPLEANGVVVARLAGGGLLGLAVACFAAREMPLGQTGLGASVALLIYNVIACAVLAGTGRAVSGRGLLVGGAAVLHGVLAVGLLGALAGRRGYA
ncbi:MAG TPA: hypothetical protein VLA89_08910 [Gemmatimonadales bacterium]|nr:hypothetical protein [Gemmatimonadales bacterium]